MLLRTLMAVAVTLGAAITPALAQSRPAATRLGTYGDWIAAWYRDGQVKVCYAFVRVGRSQPQRPGVILTVTHRGASRDDVALVAGYPYPRGAPDVTVTVGPAELPFYVGSGSAHARDRRAAVTAFRSGREAVARGSHPSRMPAIDHFSLSGFNAAYEAINRECPAAGRR